MSGLVTKTSIVALTALLGFFAVALIQGHEVTGAEVALVVGSIATLVVGNDIGAAKREEAANPAPRIDAPGAYVDAPDATIES